MHEKRVVPGDGCRERQLTQRASSQDGARAVLLMRYQHTYTHTHSYTHRHEATIGHRIMLNDQNNRTLCDRTLRKCTTNTMCVCRIHCLTTTSVCYFTSLTSSPDFTTQNSTVLPVSTRSTYRVVFSRRVVRKSTQLCSLFSSVLYRNGSLHQLLTVSVPIEYSIRIPTSIPSVLIVLFII